MATKAKNKNAKPAAKAKTPAKKITKPVAKAPVKKATKPAPKAPAKKAAKPAPKPVAKKAVKAAKPVAKKPIAKAKVVAKAKPTAKAVKPSPKKVVKPVAKAKKVVKPVAKPVAKKIVAPVAKKAVKPVAVAAKPASVAPPVAVVKSRPRRRRPVRVEVAPKPKEVKLTSANAAMISPPMLVVKPQPAPALAKQQFNADGTEKKRYSDAELKEFKELITKKLESAKEEYQLLQDQLNHANEHGTDDTAGTFKMLEDGSDTLAKEEAGQLAARQRKFIEQLENALIRVENKSYGICRVTGKLIPKERLRAVPHTTQSMEAKLNQYKEN